MSFVKKAMLAELSIHRWGATKSDRRASNEFAASKKSNPTMSRVTKTLLQSPHLVGFDQLANQARGVHYSHTMPWLDNGMRILPVKRFLDYGKDIKKITDNSVTCVNDLCDSYAGLIDTAKVQLGDLFNVTDYPPVEAVRSKFSIRMRFLPVPQENDWRVDMAAADIDKLKAELQGVFADSQNSAVEDLTDKVRVRLGKLMEILSDADDASFRRRLRESHISGLTELPEFIDTMNVFDNENLSRLSRELNEKFDFNFDAEGLKSDSSLKAKVKENVEDLIRTLG